MNINASWVNIHASRVKNPCISENHALRKVMHRELISRHREKSCITEDHASRVKNPCIAENHVSRKIMHRKLISKHRRKIFLPRKKLCITRRFHASLKFTHHEKIPCLVKIYTSRQNFIPHRNFDIERRFHTSQKFVHRFHTSRKLRIARRYSCPARRHTQLKKEIVHPMRNIYPLASTAFLYSS